MRRNKLEEISNIKKIMRNFAVKGNFEDQRIIVEMVMDGVQPTIQAEIEREVEKFIGIAKGIAESEMVD